MKNKAFSLIEVLVFVTVIAIFFVVAAAVSSFSLQVSRANENKILATRYAEELTEWLRGEKEADWNVFKTKLGNWCFNTSPLVSWPSLQGACAPSDFDLKDNNLNKVFKRDLVISDPVPNDNQLSVNITVSWQDGQNSFNVPVKTVFSRFE